ncbi:assimilatory sulfite reductase (NADPH) flavoprotein subunit [Pseudoxanthomonas sangjuensis]|uniref:assimilatory sulfite reductase (NADPH) flavoprotein subunit n=1 Tax=Pseudoxanthomonas sangjuensis TaxID=1503750 RepID=UPI00139106D0|nr:assimilatory sulfite reductase (NADPH) flavoprotein subunit [Pseudoxanthomonas sangjuensis]KAF1710996.1 assimilatory sulfite reductase (NADPH) flavoprotein subunit [Pseudoxanthomonas sangjuensis]
MSAQPASLPPSPLPEDRKAPLARALEGLDAPSLWWLSGYAAGLAQAAAPAVALAKPSVAAPPAASLRATVVYGSQTGNARRAAEQLLGDLEGAGLAARLVRADAYPTRELTQEKLLFVVISTQGEGDPPDDSIGFVEFLNGKRAPKLAELKFAVLGLGDSSYADFCGIARKLDARLAALGAQRLFALGEADLDIDTAAAPWRRQALEQARELLKSATPSATVTPLRPHASAAAHSHDKPFAAEILLNQRLTGRAPKGARYGEYGAVGKDVRHIELSLEGSGLHYEPGDALGIRHRNPAALVESVLEAAKLDGNADVAIDGEPRPLHEWLSDRRELPRLSRPFLAALAERGGDASLAALLQPEQRAGFAGLVDTHQLVDALRRWPAAWDANALVSALRAPTTRLYSIASSRKRVGDEAHLTVDVLRYDAHGHAHGGAASGFLSALDEGDRAEVFVEANERFRVPADASRDILMVGPGTGVAPFRGFVQERAETGASGRNWLFFGAQHFDADFLYQAEWQDALKRGELQRLDLAFSRDQAEKIYVQQRLRERGREVWDWLQGGAHFYVCGAIAMGKGVHAALIDIAAEHGALDRDAAGEYLTGLQAEGRYLRDVY